jgi:two-component system CheB/CheR fusion protein
VQDFSALQQAEEAARESEGRFRATFEQAAVGMALVAPDGRWLRVNRKLCNIVGYSHEEMMGLTFQDITHPDDLEADLAYVRQMLAGEITTYAMEKRYIRKDGSLVWINLTVALTHTPEGQPDYFISVVEDISEMKQAEEALKEADRGKSEFLVVLAHELRNPLAAIRNAVDLFKAGSPADPDREWGLGVIDRQSRLLTALVDDLLDVSRIGQGKVALKREPLDVRDVVARAVEVVRPLVDEKHQVLTVSLPPSPLPAEVDPIRLQQVLANLLTNAAKYTDEAGRITLTGAREGGEVVFRVRDTGIGIPAERLEKVFGLFEQLDAGHDRARGGLGIGLTLVRRLVELHGGQVCAASAGPGRGSEFTVRLPAFAEPAARKPGTTVDLPHVARRGSRVLVIDDDDDNAWGLARLLKRLGHDVRVAQDGESAIEAARTHRPQVVLLDIGLPGLDGYEVVKRLRAEECCKDALIIALSGYGQPEDLRRSREAGFDDYLVKPVNYDVLMKIFAPQPV